MVSTSLVIMAAGLGSRFGKDVKQLAKVGPDGETIMEYSVREAEAAGFSSVIFIIRKDIEERFRDEILKPLSAKYSRTGFEYVFQDCSLPSGFTPPSERKKPWGTGDALLRAADAIDSPFCVVNADDHYGPDAMSKIHDFLISGHGKYDYGMIGYRLENTVPEQGKVNRGLCAVDSRGMLTGIRETRDIERSGSGFTAGGMSLDPGTIVSMNIWGFPAEFLSTLKDGFTDFLNSNAESLTAEFIIPEYIGTLLSAEKLPVTVRVMGTTDTWLGLTYEEDKNAVRLGLRKLKE
ncbi:MAG: NDP-sugar synthase [Anaerovoracaceae bacterium]